MSKSTSITIHKEDGSTISFDAPYFAYAGRYDNNGRVYVNCSFVDAVAGAATLIADFIYDQRPTYRKRKRFALSTAYILYQLIKTYLKAKEQEEPNE